MSDIASFSIDEIARRLGGEVSRDRRGGRCALVPGPNHSPKDRSLSIALDPAAPDGFVVFSFAGDDPIICRDYIRSMLDLSPFKPGKHNNRNHNNVSSPATSPQMSQEERTKAANARATAAIERHKAKTATDHAPKRVIDVYDYVDVDNTPLFRVRRFAPKGFDQQRSDGNGGWIPGLGDDIKRVPYHLPELVAYPDATVFICEGEKDCDRVRQLELCATTISGGSTWAPELAEYLRDRDVVITPDFDKPGVEKALAAATVLHGVAKTIRIVMLPGLDGSPNANDVFDWLEADRSHDKTFVDVCLSAPLWTPGAEIKGFAAADQIDPRKKVEPTESPVEGLGEWDAGEDQSTPTPRGWLLGNSFCRCFVSSLQGDGGVGKTALRYLQMLSLAAKRALTGEHVFQRCRVLIVSLEDGPDELRRRLLAARLHHKIGLPDIEGWLFIAAIGRAAGKLVAPDNQGRPVVSDLAAKLEQTIIARRIDMVLLDPFIKTHAVNENDNRAIDEVAQVLNDLCEKHYIAIDVPHHMSKGPADPGNANRGRGASSLKDALRLVRTATVMTAEEAQSLGVSEADRRRLFRVDDAKLNVAPVSEAKWFKLVGVNIGNATDLYPAGDNVQTVELWKPPGLFTDISVPDLNAILDKIEVGLSDGNRFSDAKNVADERAAWHVIKKHCGKDKGPAKRIIKAWTESGLLFHKNYTNPVTRKDVAGLWVDNAKRPS
jgi:hypothetical protein